MNTINVDSKEYKYNTDELISKMNESHNKIKDKIKIIDDKFIKQKNKVDLSKYYRYLQKTTQLTDYAYSTIIFIDNKYIPGIMCWAYNLKYVIKTPYNLICLVQDKPYYEIDNSGNHFMKFPGLNEDEINDIKKVFDVVIGIDILSNSNLNNRKYSTVHKNIFYYCTKILCLGLTDYKKIIYLDISTFVNLSIDNIFEHYNESSYYFKYDKTKRGLPSNYYFYVPQDYYLEKGLYIIDNYLTLFENYISLYTTDEDILYYTIYPHWGTKLLDSNLYNIYLLNIQNKVNNNYQIYPNMANKQFRYTIYFKDGRFLFNNTPESYNKWDDSVKKLLVSYPELTKYFEFIKTYRYTKF